MLGAYGPRSGARARDHGAAARRAGTAGRGRFDEVLALSPPHSARGFPVYQSSLDQSSVSCTSRTCFGSCWTANAGSKRARRCFPARKAGVTTRACFFTIDLPITGGPEDFARMVRAAQHFSRGVVLDVVYNHMMESPLQVIARDVYVSGETAWGDMVYYAHPAACEFFRQALVYQWSAFCLDGFRFDSTETIVNGHRDDTP